MKNLTLLLALLCVAALAQAPKKIVAVYMAGKAVKKEMKKALSLAKKKDYKPALEAYLGIYERHKSTAAALNAAIIHHFFDDIKSAKEMAIFAEEGCK